MPDPIDTRPAPVPHLLTRGALAILFSVGAAFAGATGAAEANAPGRLALETERVVVFKDGYTLFVKRATGRTDADGVAYLEEVPDAAVLGSFWSSASGGDPILSTTADWVETVETRRRETDCVTNLELLRANEGRRVSLRMSQDRVMTGKILDVLEREPVPAAVNAVQPFRNTGYSTASTAMGGTLETIEEIAPMHGDLFVLATADQGRVVLPVSSVHSISGRDLVTTLEREERVHRRTKRLSYDFGPDAAKREVAINLMYFTPGMRWIPTYRLSGDLDSGAEMSLQGEILNEVEDIHDAALELVVGVPNFRFKDNVSPLALERTLHRALREAAPNLMSQAMQNSFTQRAGEWRGDTTLPVANDVMRLAPELASSGSHDLFVYEMPSFSLKKGARATVSVWRGSVDLRHLHTLDIGLVRNGSTGATRSRTPESGGPSPLELARYRVWHQLELLNRGDVPWTTGPVLMLRNGLPLGQDLLTYTPVGGTSLVPVTVAVDVRGDLDETEVKRTPDAIVVNRASYTAIEKRGEITLTNYKKVKVSTRVRLSLGGKVGQASHDGKITHNEARPGDWEHGNHTVNNHSDVEWTVDLAPGGQVTLDYTTMFYTR